MKLYEYEAKTIFVRYGIAVPKGKVVFNPKEAQTAAKDIGKAVAVKSQILVAGRGKAGGIKFANTPKEVEEIAIQLLNEEIKGEPVTSLLIEEKISINKELYVAITVDRFNRCYVAMASTAGGVDIEEAAQTHHAVHKFAIESSDDFHNSISKQLVGKLGYNEAFSSTLATLFGQLYQIVMDLDLELIEINPLIETVDGNFIAADARMIIDDNALFRHPDFAEKQFHDQRGLSIKEVQARKKGLEYVKLDGDIGVMGNGAGLVMSTIDLINIYGGKASNFLDIGGGATIEKIATAVKFLLLDQDIKAVFVNILGGITRCDQVAQAIVDARNNLSLHTVAKPLIVRLVGTNEIEGKQILAQAGISVYDNMEQAAQEVVKAAKYLEDS